MEFNVLSLSSENCKFFSVISIDSPAPNCNYASLLASDMRSEVTRPVNKLRASALAYCEKTSPPSFNQIGNLPN